jgi:hypothetical protein
LRPDLVLDHAYDLSLKKPQEIKADFG